MLYLSLHVCNILKMITQCPLAYRFLNISCSDGHIYGTLSSNRSERLSCTNIIRERLTALFSHFHWDR